MQNLQEQIAAVQRYARAEENAARLLERLLRHQCTRTQWREAQAELRLASEALDSALGDSKEEPVTDLAVAP